MGVIETAVYKEAEECITLLATKLGEKDYFFGQSPCSLDAVVFAHLAPLLKAPLPSSVLQNHLKACTNLPDSSVEYYNDSSLKIFKRVTRRNVRVTSRTILMSTLNFLTNCVIMQLQHCLQL